MRIVGIGVVSKMGNNVETILQNLNNNTEEAEVDKIKFDLDIDRTKKRRIR